VRSILRKRRAKRTARRWRVDLLAAFAAVRLLARAIWRGWRSV
jgi:hypothetical protein